MSYELQNLLRFARGLADDPAAAPGRLAAALKARTVRSREHLFASTGLGKTLHRQYRGSGVVAMFHEIHEDVDGGLRMGCSPDQLRQVLQMLRADGRDFVTVEEALRRLADPDSRDFAVISFDDGYRDNRDLALPVLEEFNAPMILFVPTGMVTRMLYAWWLCLRHVLLTRDAVDVEAMGMRLSCGDAASRNAALREITSWIGTDQARADALQPMFAKLGISNPALIDAVALSEAEVKAFADHPLVTIGGHTTTHRFLSRLDEADARADIADNRAYLEGLLDRPVLDFAYPYGSPAACGEREARLVAEAGYRSAFTTRPGHLFAEHLKAPVLLPREDMGQGFQPRQQIAARIEGWRRALVLPGASPVAGLE